MNHTNSTNTRPRIYVASLADYNAGRLLGGWIDADQGAEHIRNEINAMLATSKEAVAEDWAIHDYEGFSGLSLSEFSDIDLIAEVAELLGEHGNVFAELVAHFGGLTSGLAEARQSMEFGYLGNFETLGDYVDDFINDCYSEQMSSLPDFIKYHIDYDSIGKDLELSGDIITFQVDGVVHVFSGNI